MQFSETQLTHIRECAKDEQSYQTLLEMLGHLHEGEARYRVLTEMMTDYTYAYKVLPVGQYELEWIEGAFSQITGYTPDEWQQNGLASFVHPDDSHFIEAHMQFLAAGQPYEDEYRIVTKDGQVRWIQDYAKPVIDIETHKVIRVIGASRDITREKAAETAHHDAQQRFRLLADYSSDIISIQSPEGKFEYLSPSVYAVTGYKSQELIGRNALEFIHQDDVPVAQNAFRAIVRQGKTHTYSFRIQHREGQYVWLEAASVPITDPISREVTGIHSTSRDVTERKQSDDERERLINELEAYNHTVAHDLKNPLNTVLGFANILEEFHESFTLDERMDLYHKIVRSGNKMMNIIEELLLLSGLRVNEIIVEPLVMGAIITEVIERLNFMIEDYRPTLHISSNWPVAVGHRQWVEEIWANYLSNALKYGGKPPEVIIGADTPHNGVVRFWVRDNGLGLLPDDMSRIFKPFTRLDRVRAQGHGLGLSIVQRIAERLGGQVGVESTFGEGCLFYFTLPSQT